MSEEVDEKNYIFVEGKAIDDGTQQSIEIIFVIDIVNYVGAGEEIQELHFVSLNPLKNVKKVIYERTILVKIDVIINETSYEKVYMTTNITRNEFENTINNILHKWKNQFK